MGDQATGKMCGTGRDCEQHCPIMRIGRECPALPNFIDELLAATAEDPQPAFQLA